MNYKSENKHLKRQIGKLKDQLETAKVVANGVLDGIDLHCSDSLKERICETVCRKTGIEPK